jgi:hypothetical protein
LFFHLCHGDKNRTNRPPEIRQVFRYAPFPSFRRFVSLDYRPADAAGFVLANSDKRLGDSSFLSVGCLRKKTRTDKPASLHSYIPFTWFFRVCGVRRSVTQGFLTLFAGLWAASSQRRQQGVLISPRYTTSGPTTKPLKRNGSHPKKTLLLSAPFLMRSFVMLKADFFPHPPPFKEIYFLTILGQSNILDNSSIYWEMVNDEKCFDYHKYAKNFAFPYR